ncbi:aminoglycoside phosphotransferase family protein [Paenibacillus albicereus]|uniref:Aminoglycoside phosphotransferase family protein n=1 Tax=Paenibacillus albicereus TaxID=2726185 RepID=A0A6H2H2I7_9BACL|nr:aminoglycoside phosphotransferase family protein [Paenibacillus albicereus]QJC53913.1 aminoglycoside phosphotransferase family protein [Paenibacillus albicereus]
MEHAPGPVAAQGRTAQICSYGDDQVLKWFKESIPRLAAEQELAASRVAASAGLPVPKAYFLAEWQGRPAIAFERIAGSTMLAVLYRQPWRIVACGARMARLHIDIHRTGAGPDSGMPCLIDSLKRRIQAAPLLAESEKEAAIAALLKLPAGRQLLHGDFHPGNVILGGGKAWVVDWMTAVSGHPAADAARTVLLLRTAMLPEELSRLSSFVFNRVRAMLLCQYRRTYLRLSGLEQEELEAWMLPLAAARLCEQLPPEEKLLLHKLVQSELRRQPPLPAASF